MSSGKWRPSCLGLNVLTTWCVARALSYNNDLTLSQSFQPMVAQLSKKAALPLAKIIATTSCRNSKTGPRITTPATATCPICYEWHKLLLVVSNGGKEQSREREPWIKNRDRTKRPGTPDGTHLMSVSCVILKYRNGKWWSGVATGHSEIIRVTSHHRKLDCLFKISPRLTVHKRANNTEGVTKPWRHHMYSIHV